MEMMKAVLVRTQNSMWTHSSISSLRSITWIRMMTTTGSQEGGGMEHTKERSPSSKGSEMMKMVSQIIGQLIHSSMYSLNSPQLVSMMIVMGCARRQYDP